jgi:hypothetical protein
VALFARCQKRGKEGSSRGFGEAGNGGGAHGAGVPAGHDHGGPRR